MERRRAPHAAIAHLAQLRQRPSAVMVPRIGLALGGGFARGITHAGVLKIFERHGIPYLETTDTSIEEIASRVLERLAIPRRVRP